MTWVWVERRSCDQDNRKNNIFAFSANLRMAVALAQHNLSRKYNKCLLSGYGKADKHILQ